MYIDGPDGLPRFRRIKAPSNQELTQLVETIARRVGRFLERQRLLDSDVENSYLAEDAVDDDPLNQLLGHSITYRIAVGPQAGRKVFTLQTLPACEPEDRLGVRLGKAAGFPLHAGVAAASHERKKLEWLCRYISRPMVSEKRLSLTPNGSIRYQLKSPYKDGTTHVMLLGAFCGRAIRQSCQFVMARLAALVPKPRVNLTRLDRMFPDRILRITNKIRQLLSHLWKKPHTI